MRFEYILYALSVITPALSQPLDAASQGRAVRSLKPRQCASKAKNGGKGGDGGNGGWRHETQGSGNSQPPVGDSPVDGQNAWADVNDRPSSIQTSIQFATSTQLQIESSEPSVAPPKPSPQRQTQPPPPDTDGSPSPANDSDTTGKISTADPKQLLKLHNDYRAARGAGPLVWNDSLQTYATEYALGCKQGHS